VRLGTSTRCEAFTFACEDTGHGRFQARAYRFDDGRSTVTIEAPAI
jgi:anthraniloyl-CoA monooxygenase